MPYIGPGKRIVYDTEITLLVNKLRLDQDGIDGNTNYVITRIVAGTFAPATGKWRYMMIARAVGCFICACFEFYFRVGRKREDEVIQENGDIPEYE